MFHSKQRIECIKGKNILDKKNHPTEEKGLSISDYISQKCLLELRHKQVTNKLIQFVSSVFQQAVLELR